MAGLFKIGTGLLYVLMTIAIHITNAWNRKKYHITYEKYAPTC